MLYPVTQSVCHHPHQSEIIQDYLLLIPPHLHHQHRWTQSRILLSHLQSSCQIIKLFLCTKYFGVNYFQGSVPEDFDELLNWSTPLLLQQHLWLHFCPIIHLYYVTIKYVVRWGKICKNNKYLSPICQYVIIIVIDLTRPHSADIPSFLSEHYLVLCSSVGCYC